MNGPSPQEVRGLYPLQAPQSLGPRSERRDSPKCLDLKTNRAYLTEKLRTSGNKEFLPLQQNHSPQDPAQRATVSKELRPYVKEIHLLTLQHLSKGQKSAGTLSRTVTLLIFTGFLYFAGDSGQHWWNLTLTC